MRNVTDSTALTTQLQAICKITEQFAKDGHEKSNEQLISEIDFIKGLLDQTKTYLVKKDSSIL